MLGGTLLAPRHRNPKKTTTHNRATEPITAARRPISFSPGSPYPSYREKPCYTLSPVSRCRLRCFSSGSDLGEKCDVDVVRFVRTFFGRGDAASYLPNILLSSPEPLGAFTLREPAPEAPRQASRGGYVPSPLFVFSQVLHKTWRALLEGLHTGNASFCAASDNSPSAEMRRISGAASRSRATTAQPSCIASSARRL